MSHQPVRLPSEQRCPTCNAPVVKVRVRENPYADWGCSMESDVLRYDGGSGVAARIDADELRQLASRWKQTSIQRSAEVCTSGIPTVSEVEYTKKGGANGLYEAAVDLENLLKWRAVSAGGGTEPHDGDVSRLLRLWAKPLRGLLNRPEDALALERAADVIESGGMDSVFTNAS